MKSQKNVLLALVAALLMMAQQAQAAVTLDPALSQQIADGILTVLAIIAIGGAGYLTIALAGVGWTVGAKFIKRLGGKA